MPLLAISSPLFKLHFLESFSPYVILSWEISLNELSLGAKSGLPGDSTMEGWLIQPTINIMDWKLSPKQEVVTSHCSIFQRDHRPHATGTHCSGVLSAFSPQRKSPGPNAVPGTFNKHQKMLLRWMSDEWTNNFFHSHINVGLTELGQILKSVILKPWIWNLLPSLRRQEE